MEEYVYVTTITVEDMRSLVGNNEHVDFNYHNLDNARSVTVKFYPNVREHSMTIAFIGEASPDNPNEPALLKSDPNETIDKD